MHELGKKTDETQYWIKRHEVSNGTLAAVGQKSYSDKANYYIYKLTLERYDIILDQLKFSKPLVSVLDAGGGKGAFLDLFLKRKYDVTLVDISPIAIENLETLYGNRVNMSTNDLANLPLNQRYDIVHCFDVLYHILDNKKWAKVLENFSRIANRYIILHERFLRRRPIVLSKHIKFRSYETTTQKLQELGFREINTIATHFWGCRLLSYRLAGFSPQFFYNIDKLTLGFLDKRGNKWGSYHIKVFEKS